MHTTHQRFKLLLLDRKIQFSTEKVTPGVRYHLCFASSKGNYWLFHESESQVSETFFLSTVEEVAVLMSGFLCMQLEMISRRQHNLSFLAGAFQHLCNYFKLHGSRSDLLQLLYKQLAWPVCDTKHHNFPLPESKYHLTFKHKSPTIN